MKTILSLRTYFRIARRMLWFVLMLVWSLPVLMVLQALGLEWPKRRLTTFVFKGICWGLGIRVRVQGMLAAERPLLLASNHVSYADILVLGGIHTIAFVPKSEVASWPVIGFIARLIGCVFVERKRLKAKDSADALANALQKRAVLCLFPEGTTSNGQRILPFKSSLFAAVEKAMQAGQELTIQPVKLLYSRINGLPTDSTQQPELAWIGDMLLLPHLLRLLSFRRIEASVEFGPRWSANTFANRKEMAAGCEAFVVSR